MVIHRLLNIHHKTTQIQHALLPTKHPPLIIILPPKQLTSPFNNITGLPHHTTTSHPPLPNTPRHCHHINYTYPEKNIFALLHSFFPPGLWLGLFNNNINIFTATTPRDSHKYLLWHIKTHTIQLNNIILCPNFNTLTNSSVFLFLNVAHYQTTPSCCCKQTQTHYNNNNNTTQKYPYNAPQLSILYEWW